MKYYKDEKNKPKLSIKQKAAARPKALRITGLDAPSRQIMSEAGRMLLEARKLGRAGDKEGARMLRRRAAAEKIAGEPTVKSQAFVDAQERAKGGEIDYGQQMQDMIDEFMRNRTRRDGDGITEPDEVRRGQETRY